MNELIKKWWKKAEDDLEKAEILYKNKKYDGTVFYCQQAIEKGLKALELKRTKNIKKIHDLVELGKDINLPENLLNYCKEITLSYIYARYPDVEEDKNLSETAKKFMKYSKEILKWIEREM